MSPQPVDEHLIFKLTSDHDTVLATLLLAKVLGRLILHTYRERGKARFTGRTVVGRVGLEPTTTRL